MSAVQELTVEFMEEFYAHVCAKTPSFMPRPAEEVALANSLANLLTAAMVALASAKSSAEITAGMTPLVENMILIMAAYTEEGDERDSWMAQLNEFRSYVTEELANGP